jgi:hypothetical protein
MIIYIFLMQVAAWQQHVSYEILARLNTYEHGLSATADLKYFNGSPFTLDTLYFYLHANALSSELTYYAREAEKMGDDRFSTMSQDAYGGSTIENVESNGVGLSFDIQETILKVPLQQSLVPGASVSLRIDFSIKIPREVHDFGYWPGHYEMTYWYPKICVFDMEGWHLEPLHPLGGTYGEFADYDVTIELPADYVIAATGRRIEEAGTEIPDSTSILFGRLEHGEFKRVRFVAEDVSDFVWVCDQEFGVKAYDVENIHVSIFYRPESEIHCDNTFRYVADAIFRFKRWFGDLPYGELCIVDGFYQGNVVFPQLIIIRMKEDKLTRFFETRFADQVANQWFSAVVGVDGSKNEWLGRALSTYATMRYMEDKYGVENSLIKISLLPPLSLKYYHRLYYYLMQTNEAEGPVAAALSYFSTPISYENSVRSKPALFLLSLENLYGRDQFDEMLKGYFREHKFQHARSEDFATMCEGADSQEVRALFEAFLHTTEYCDWAVGRVTDHTVEIENRGNLMIPIDAHVVTGSGEQVYRIDGSSRKQTIVVPDTLGEIKKVSLDPSEQTMDPDYWNNYAPRRILIKPVFDFDWPSFSAYQILWTPYLWYDNYDGMTAGFYVFGDKFADFDFVKGGNQVMAGYIYGFGSQRHYPSLTYQTPVHFQDGLRMRVLFEGLRSRGGDNVNVGFSCNLGAPFTQEPQIGITNLISYDRLSSYSGLDSIDWELGRNITLDNQFRFRHPEMNIHAGLSLAHHSLGSKWEYLKTTFVVQRSYESPIPFSVRLYVGKIFGSAPTQEMLFLSGLLRIDRFTDLFFNQFGTYSPQERIHIAGDGNMRGYQTMHIKSDQMYVLNLEFPSRSLVRIFSDIGYYEKFAFDVGMRLVVGAETFAKLPFFGFNISFNLPLYAYTPGEPWKLRWSVSFSS